MAVRRPLKISGSDLKEMSDTDIENVQKQMISLWAADPTITLSVVGAGGNLGTITDERLLAGRIIAEGNPLGTNVTKNTISYSRINQNIDSSEPAVVDINNTAYPVYYTDSGHIQAMNDSDFQDTFVTPALTTLTSTTASKEQAGTYFISSTNLVADADLVSAVPVFVDTLADADAFTSGPIPEDSDQYIIVNSYYLHKLRRNTNINYDNFLLIDSNNDLREMNDSDNDSLLLQYMRYASTSLNGNKLRYSYTTGNVRGTAMVDTILDSDQAVLREGEVISEYSAYDQQEVPAGQPQVNQTHYLRINLA